MIKPRVKEWNIQLQDFLENIHFVEPGFHLRLELEITADGLKGSDQYNVDLCDRKGLNEEIDRYFESDFEKLNNRESAFLDKTILLKEFDREKIMSLINDFVDSCSAETWKEVSLKLQEKLEYSP